MVKQCLWELNVPLNLVKKLIIFQKMMQKELLIYRQFKIKKIK